MTDQKDAEFSWEPLGEAWWLEAQATCGATDLQVRFACCRHRGMTRTLAARLAGYKGTADSIRQSASDAAKTNAVVNMLALAAAETGSGDDGTLGPAEAKRILSRLARNSDPTVRIKAIESLQKIEQAKQQRGEAPSDDGFGAWRVERDFLRMPNGGSAYLLLQWASGGTFGSFCLLHDTFSKVMLEPRGRELWDQFYRELPAQDRADLDRRLADPDWQLDARRKIWAEVGMKPPSPIGQDPKDMLARDGITAMVNGSGEGGHAVA